jgi:uncharacterized protein DUF955
MVVAASEEYLSQPTIEARLSSLYDLLLILFPGPNEKKELTTTSPGHELCHVWLMRQAEDGHPAPLVRYRNTQNLPGLHQDPLEEYLCNFFAGELLIPSGELQDRFKNKVVGPTSVFKLANEFFVSPQTAAIQLSNAMPGTLVACCLWNLESLWPLPMCVDRKQNSYQGRVAST